jgi:predicted DNA-binding transcriptional regulator YafY
MNRLDRALGILLLLRGGKRVSAPELSKRFEVSARTIYRDIAALAELGVPVFAEPGRGGGFRLMSGYFVPPVMFTTGEMTSLLVGLALLRRLKARPFAADLDTAEQKLLAAVPEHLRQAIARAPHIIGFERTPADLFHPEPESLPEGDAYDDTVSATISTFLQGTLDRKALALQYCSPYRGDERRKHEERLIVAPCGLFWDRERWYLVGKKRGRDRVQLWRADRVTLIEPDISRPDESAFDFDVNRLLGRQWLREAMAHWIKSSPVTLRLTQAQADRLRQDWYYRHAQYRDAGDGGVLLTFGEDDQARVFELLRWLGPGAALVEPAAWRAAFRAELEAMLEADRQMDLRASN